MNRYDIEKCTVTLSKLNNFTYFPVCFNELVCKQVHVLYAIHDSHCLSCYKKYPNIQSSNTMTLFMQRHGYRPLSARLVYVTF